MLKTIVYTLNDIADGVLSVLFGVFENHLVDETDLGRHRTEKGHYYQLTRGRYIRCRSRIFPFIKHLPFYGKSGWRFTTFNRITGNQVTYTTADEKEIVSIVDTSNQLTTKQLMEQEF